MSVFYHYNLFKNDSCVYQSIAAKGTNHAKVKRLLYVILIDDQTLQINDTKDCLSCLITFLAMSLQSQPHSASICLFPRSKTTILPFIMPIMSPLSLAQALAWGASLPCI